MLKLLRFRTQNFRSIEDSGWTDLEKVTAFVGINESGKSNLLASLWKLNPAREGEIHPLSDYPRARYNEFRNLADKPVFITAVFEGSVELTGQLGEMSGLAPRNFREIQVSRDLAGNHEITFPNCDLDNRVPAQEVLELISQGASEVTPINAEPTEETLKVNILAALQSAQDSLTDDLVDFASFNNVVAILNGVALDSAASPRLSAIFSTTQSNIEAIRPRLNRTEPAGIAGVDQLVLQSIPKFVYYSSYGNLDSEIYLPQVIQNLSREDLGSKEEAKARTLKVLFDFVRLQPQEILELGTESEEDDKTEEAIAAEAENKKEREVLLTSASGDLTDKFRAWWKQGNYRFRFQADGTHFRIWVSDDLRTEEIELECRSTGLQWFFSFYLVFLVESGDQHEETILLLDEAGLALHPLAQRDLSNFFESLENQIIYTTHSPFLVEHDKLNQVRSVYLDESGRTSITADLRANPRLESSEKSIYAVHVSMGLSVSDTFLLGCQPVIVEGISDQRYLSTIKNYLIGARKINPARELVFLPSGGAGSKGVTATVSIVAAREEELPYVLLDADAAGTNMSQSLKSNAYSGDREKVLSVGDFLQVDRCEVEDLIEGRVLADVISRYLPRAVDIEDEFIDIYQEGEPIIPQVERYSEQNNLELNKGWKVEIATRFKNKFDRLEFSEETIALWKALFDRIIEID